jgi:hypothetical protein
MNPEKEPEQLASIAVSRDEIATHQRPSGRMRPISHPSAGAPKLLWALTVFAILLAMGLMIQLQQVKSQSDKQLQALTILQERLVSTDEQANLSVDAIKILLKEQDHEIRKLWDLANKRNKKDIAKAKERLDDQNKLITQHSAKLGQISKDSESLKKSVNKQIKDGIAPLDSDVKSLSKSVSTIEKKVDKTISSLPKNVAKTLNEHDKGIKAMDATRLQLMKRIKSLEKEIKALKSTSTSIKAP